MGDPISGAACGVVLQELVNIVRDARNKALSFKPLLKRLETTLQSLTPKVDEIAQLNEELNEGGHDHDDVVIRELTRLLTGARELVIECSKLRWWWYKKKHHYATKLEALDDSIIRLCQVNLPVEGLAAIKLLCLQVKVTNKRLDQLNSTVNETRCCCRNLSDAVDSGAQVRVPRRDIPNLLLFPRQSNQVIPRSRSWSGSSSSSSVSRFHQNLSTL